jgi:hypothetical protein
MWKQWSLSILQIKEVISARLSDVFRIVISSRAEIWTLALAFQSSGSEPPCLSIMLWWVLQSVPRAYVQTCKKYVYFKIMSVYMSCPCMSLVLGVVFWALFVCFCGTGVWTLLGFTLAKWILHHLSHTANLFCPGYFGDGGLSNYLLRLASNYDPPNLCLPNS